jgi:hypothetical protein
MSGVVSEWCGQRNSGGEKGRKRNQGGDEVSDAVICEGGMIEPDQMLENGQSGQR